MNILFTKVNPEAKIPTYGTDGSAGFDIYSIVNTTIMPWSKEVIPTGFKTIIKSGYYVEIASRSGLALKFDIEKGAGIIDEDFCLEWKVILRNLSSNPFHITAGERIAQGILKKYEKAVFNEVDEEVFRKFEKGTRTGGFGSTGR